MTDYWNHNTAYHSELIAAVPGPDAQVLDVGCGDGLLLQKLASVAGHVVGIEPDVTAVAQARSRLARESNVDVVHGGLLDSPELDGQRFDFITCVATLHHLPLVPALKRLRDLLVPGGRLRVVGLAANKSVVDWLISAALVVPVRLMSQLHRESEYSGMVTAPVREPLKEIRDTAKTVLPGCRIRRRFYYRYTLNWVKPPGY